MPWQQVPFKLQHPGIDRSGSPVIQSIWKGWSAMSRQNTESKDSQLDARPSPLAGSWYPADPGVLKSSIQSYLDSAHDQHIEGQIQGIIVPHAGHQYSGKTAAQAFNLLSDLKPQYVAVISPSHQPVPGKLVTSAHQAYETPLGIIPINLTMMGRLKEILEKNGLTLRAVRHDREHSLEIELPFLQTVFSHHFELLPVMIADQSTHTASTLGAALAELLDNENALIIASTDLSHFHPRQIALSFDTEMLSRIEAFDPEGVIRAEEEGFGFACGRGAAAAALWACQKLGADSVQVLGYSTSGDVTGDHSSVVGYGSAVIYQQHMLQGET